MAAVTSGLEQQNERKHETHEQLGTMVDGYLPRDGAGNSGGVR